MSIATEITRITNAKTAIKAAIEEKGVSVGDGKIDSFAEKIAQIVTGGIDGAAGGKFTWNGNYPVQCDCSGMDSAPTGFMIYCPYLVNIGVGSFHVFVAVKELGAQTSKHALKILGNNETSTYTYEGEIIYDSTLKAVKIKSETGMKLVNGKDYYWTVL